jgi:hypothetical protein
MTTNTSVNAPYLRTSRSFPEDAQQLTRELEKSYIDIAQNVNHRTIGIFPTNKSIVNGEQWFIKGGKQQGSRQIYTFTAPGNIPHGINISLIYGFTKIYGTFVDAAGIWYPLPYVDVVSATNQVNVIVNATNIVITAGAGAPPTIASGFCVLEWISNI